MKKLRAYHVTRHIKTVMKDGIVRPARMECVYLLKSRKDVNRYASLYGGNGAVTVEFNSSDIERRWSASYAKGGAIRLKEGATAKVLRQIVIRKVLSKIPKPGPFLLTKGIGKRFAMLPRSVPVGFDGRKAGGSNPRLRQVAVADLNRMKKSPEWYMSLDEIQALRKWLGTVEKWVAERDH